MHSQTLSSRLAQNIYLQLRAIRTIVIHRTGVHAPQHNI